LYEAAREPKELWLVEEAGHCDAYFLDRKTYCERVANFFEEHLYEASSGTDRPERL